MSALSLIFVLALTLHLSHCYCPPRAEIEGYYQQQPGLEPFGKLYSHVTNNVEMYVSGVKEPVTGKAKVLEAVRAFPTANQDTQILSIITSANTATIHRRTQIVGNAGCIAQQRSLDILTFDEAGKIKKFEWYPDRSPELIVAEANCKGIFGPEELQKLITKDDGKQVPWTRETLRAIFTDDIELSLPGGLVIRGYEPAQSFSESLGYKYVVVKTEDVFVVPKTNTVLIRRATQFATTTNCIFHTESIVKIDYSWPDGRIKRWEIVISTGNEEERCPHTKEKKGEL